MTERLKKMLWRLDVWRADAERSREQLALAEAIIAELEAEIADERKQEAAR